ncbi:hypothetical protein Ate01nite_28730 [Actinoplanes teichomyceticus]|nr:hypothetical protein Ate01nite_28730 [Actinoplanes teichomyceticus]
MLGHSSPLPTVATRTGELFRSLFERSGVGVAVLDSRCRITRVNADMLAMLHREAAEVSGLAFTELLPGDGRGRLLNGLDGVRAGTERRFGDHVRLLRPDGEPVEADLTAVPLRRTGSHVTSVLIVLVRSRRPAPAPTVAGTRVLSRLDARILEGVAAGASTMQLASQLYLSRQGVEYHVSAMLRKLNAPNRPALVSRAYELGILAVGVWPPRARPEYVH